MAGWTRWVWLVLVLVVSVPGAAMAQGDDSMDVEAHALFEAGRTAFAAGRFSDALAHFQGAYDLSHRGALLYNIAQCHDRLRHDAEALAAFEGYIAAVPDAPQRGEVESRIAILREALARTTAAQTTTTTTTTTASTDTTASTGTTASTETTTASTETAASAESEGQGEGETAPPVVPASSGPGAAPWIVLGVGAAVAVAGAVLVGVAFGDISSVENAPMGSEFSAVRSAYDQAPILSGVGWACLGVGAAMAVAGVVWGVAGSSGGSGEHAELRIGPAGLSLTGAF